MYRIIVYVICITYYCTRIGFWVGWDFNIRRNKIEESIGWKRTKRNAKKRSLIIVAPLIPNFLQFVALIVAFHLRDDGGHIFLFFIFRGLRQFLFFSNFALEFAKAKCLSSERWCSGRGCDETLAGSLCWKWCKWPEIIGKKKDRWKTLVRQFDQYYS